MAPSQLTFQDRGIEPARPLNSLLARKFSMKLGNVLKSSLYSFMSMTRFCVVNGKHSRCQKTLLYCGVTAYKFGEISGRYESFKLVCCQHDFFSQSDDSQAVIIFCNWSPVTYQLTYPFVGYWLLYGSVTINLSQGVSDLLILPIEFPHSPNRVSPWI